MRALLFVYLWWQLWLIQYQYGGLVTAMLAWKKGYWNESSTVYLWWQLWLIQYQYGGPVTAMLAWKKGYWNESSMFVYLWWQLWLIQYQYEGLVTAMLPERRDIEMRALLFVYLWWQLWLIQYQYEGLVTAMLAWKKGYWNESSIVRLSLVTTLIDSVPIWRSSDCHVSLKEGILKWELYCSSISGDNFDWFSTNMEVQWLPC